MPPQTLCQSSELIDPPPPTPPRHALRAREEGRRRHRSCGRECCIETDDSVICDNPAPTPAGGSHKRKKWMCANRSMRQFLISMALRMPSLSRLKPIDTAKIIAPGKAATQGLM